MIYIFETELSKNKSVQFALKNIYGIGKSTAFSVCKKLGFSSNLLIKDLTEQQLLHFERKLIEFNLNVADELKKKLILNNMKQISIKSYKGLRKLQGLPVRGQRTHSNAKTSKKKLPRF